MLFNFPACILLALEDGFSSIHIFPCLSLLGEKWYCLFPKLYVSKVSMYLRASASHLVLVFQFLSTSLCFQKMFVPEHVCETSCNTSKTSCSTSRCTQPMQLTFFSRRHRAVTVLKPLVMATSFNSGTQASKLDARLTKEQPNLINEELDLQDADSEA